MKSMNQALGYRVEGRQARDKSGILALAITSAPWLWIPPRNKVGNSLANLLFD